MGHFGVVQAKQKLSLFVPFLYLVLKVVAELLLSEPGRKSYRWIGGKKVKGKKSFTILSTTSALI